MLINLKLKVLINLEVKMLMNLMVKNEEVDQPRVEGVD